MLRKMLVDVEELIYILLENKAKLYDDDDKHTLRTNFTLKLNYPNNSEMHCVCVQKQNTNAKTSHTVQNYIIL